MEKHFSFCCLSNEKLVKCDKGELVNGTDRRRTINVTINRGRSTNREKSSNAFPMEWKAGRVES